MRTFFFKTFLTCCLTLCTAGVFASDNKDHDRARQALESGEILALRTILEKIEPAYAGQILEVELERKDDRWIYEVKMLQKDGLVIKLKVNAQDASVLSEKKK